MSPEQRLVNVFRQVRSAAMKSIVQSSRIRVSRNRSSGIQRSATPMTVAAGAHRRPRERLARAAGSNQRNQNDEASKHAVDHQHSAQTIRPLAPTRDRSNGSPAPAARGAPLGARMVKPVDDRGQGARLARRDERAYCWDVTEEQRSPPGCIGCEGDRLSHSRALSVSAKYSVLRRPARSGARRSNQHRVEANGENRRGARVTRQLACGRASSTLRMASITGSASVRAIQLGVTSTNRTTWLESMITTAGWVRLCQAPGRPTRAWVRPRTGR